MWLSDVLKLPSCGLRHKGIFLLCLTLVSHGVLLNYNFVTSACPGHECTEPCGSLTLVVRHVQYHSLQEGEGVCSEAKRA